MKKKDLLQEELNRFKKILNYNNVNEVSYRFYNEAEEDEPMGDDLATQDADPNATGDNAALEPSTDPVNPGGEQPAADAPVQDPNAQQAQPAPAPQPDPNVDPNAMPPADPNMAGQPGGEQDTEVDVTEIINKIQDSSNKIDMVFGKVAEIEVGLTRMDAIIAQMGELSKQVELMRPPTEEERRKALTDKSYPYSVTQADAINGTGTPTQTQLENKPDKKLSMMDNLMANYNKDEVKRSFYPSEGIDNEKENKY